MCADDNISDLLPLYYKRIFPYEPYYAWLSYGNVTPDYFSHREFSFTLANDVYIRYLSFDTQEALEKEIKKTLPHKIDIGAVYTLRPKNHKMRDQFQPKEKELVFDIDISDYDDIRTCCSGASICNKCWKYLAVASKILDAALREDFGYKHLLWIFSGRRGIHCWICDKEARKLTNTARAAIVDYLNIISGGDKVSKRVVLINRIHPSIRRAVKMIEDIFVPVCVVEQDILGTQEACQKFLPLILDAKLKSDVETAFADNSSSLDRWKAFVDLVRDYHAKGMLKKNSVNVIEEIMLQYAYPRLDINVSKSLNHLLKSPFCIHPKTGMVCVPFLSRNSENFDVFSVPKLSTLVEEISEYDKKCDAINGSAIKAKIQEYKKTTLNKYVNIFQEFLRPLEASLAKNLQKDDLLF